MAMLDCAEEAFRQMTLLCTSSSRSQAEPFGNRGWVSRKPRLFPSTNQRFYLCPATTFFLVNIPKPTAQPSILPAVKDEADFPKRILP